MRKLKHVELVDTLEKIVKLTQSKEEIALQEIFAILSGKGLFVFFILLSLPFCLPLQIPGISTPFGVMLAILSLRLIFRRKVFWPKWILEKKIKSSGFEKVLKKVIICCLFLKRMISSRLVFLTKPSWMKRVHGVFLFFCSLFLSLPLPIPLTNFLAAFPMVCISLGLLEEDGVCIIVGYSIVVLSGFFGIVFFR